MNTVASKVDKLIRPVIEDMGFDVVLVTLLGSARPCLQIMTERNDGSPVNVDDCARISRAVSATLDVDDPIPGAYTLEVSSPGIDRPLVRRADFERHVGFEAKLQTHVAVDGRKRFRGRIAALGEDTIELQTDSGAVSIPFDQVASAKLVITDELLGSARDKREQTNV